MVFFLIVSILIVVALFVLCRCLAKRKERKKQVYWAHIRQAEMEHFEKVYGQQYAGK